jgi:hypothetical protein
MPAKDETVDRKTRDGPREEERVLLFGTDQRITSRPATKRPQSKAEYVTAPERFADSQIPPAPRGAVHTWSISDIDCASQNFEARLIAGTALSGPSLALS